MTDPFQLIRSIMQSTITQRLLAAVVIGNATAYLLRFGGTTVTWLTFAFLLMLAISFTASGYIQYHNSKNPDPDSGPDLHNPSYTTYYNCFLLFLLVMTLSLWF